MLSVLIPTYNYKVSKLISAVHEQLSTANTDFEIICMEDGSDPSSVRDNESIKSLEHTKHLISESNHGRLETRKLLCKAAKYDWLLFLDADTLPKSEAFIQNYLDAITPSTGAIFGGFAYYSDPPKKDYLLRWRYGRKYEAIPATKRNKTPYKVIISANFLIKKEVFEKLDLKKHNGLYGYDSYFSAQLKTHHINVVHIDNEVFHLGIEPSKNYLNKKEQAAQTLLFLYNGNYLENQDNGLLKLFKFLKKTGLNHAMSILYRWFNKSLKKNLTGDNPSTNQLQLYRIAYLCYIDRHGVG